MMVDVSALLGPAVEFVYAEIKILYSHHKAFRSSEHKEILDRYQASLKRWNGLEKVEQFPEELRLPLLNAQDILRCLQKLFIEKPKDNIKNLLKGKKSGWLNQVKSLFVELEKSCNLFDSTSARLETDSARICSPTKATPKPTIRSTPRPTPRSTSSNRSISPSPFSPRSPTKDSCAWTSITSLSLTGTAFWFQEFKRQDEVTWGNFYDALIGYFPKDMDEDRRFMGCDLQTVKNFIKSELCTPERETVNVHSFRAFLIRFRADNLLIEKNGTILRDVLQHALSKVSKEKKTKDVLDEVLELRKEIEDQRNSLHKVREENERVIKELERKRMDELETKQKEKEMLEQEIRGLKQQLQEAREEKERTEKPAPLLTHRNSLSLSTTSYSEQDELSTSTSRRSGGGGFFDETGTGICRRGSGGGSSGMEQLPELEEEKSEQKLLSPDETKEKEEENKFITPIKQAIQDSEPKTTITTIEKEREEIFKKEIENGTKPPRGNFIEEWKLSSFFNSVKPWSITSDSNFLFCSDRKHYTIYRYTFHGKQVDTYSLPLLDKHRTWNWKPKAIEIINNQFLYILEEKRILQIDLLASTDSNKMNNNNIISLDFPNEIESDKDIHHKRSLYFKVDPITQWIYLTRNNKQHQIYVYSWIEKIFLKSFGNKYNQVSHRRGEFDCPYGLTLDSDHLYICDKGNHRIQILNKTTGKYNYHFGSKGNKFGYFILPRCIYLYEQLLYITDSYRIQVFNKKNGKFLYVIGNGNNKGGKEKGNFSQPRGIYVRDKKLFVCDYWNERIQIFNC